VERHRRRHPERQGQARPGHRRARTDPDHNGADLDADQAPLVLAGSATPGYTGGCSWLITAAGG